MFQRVAANQPLGSGLLQNARKPPVIIVDGNNVAIRGWMVNLDRKRSDGTPSGLVYAGLSSFSSLVRKHPEGIQLWCWDGGGVGWRKRECAEYKAHREPWEREKIKDFAAQTKALKTILHMLGAPSLTVFQVEADDLVGILSREALLRGCQVVVRSADQDYFQLLEEGRLVIHNGRKEITEKRMKATFGVGPKNWVAFRALTGDSSDGLKGIGGIGPVKALAAFRDRQQRILWTEKRREIFTRNKRLMTIVCDKTDSRMPQGLEGMVSSVFSLFVFGTRVVASYDALKLVGQWELPELAEEMWGFLPL